MGSAMGILGCGLCPHGRSRRRRWSPAQPLLHYKPVGPVVWYSRSGQVPSLQGRGAGSAPTGSSLLRRCSGELSLRAPATCRGWRYLVERKSAGNWDCECRRFVGEPRPNGVVLPLVAGSGQRAAQNGRGDERYELSHWCDERVDGKLPPYGSTAGINGRCAGATACAGGGAGDRIGGDGRVGAWRSWEWEWEEKERDQSFLDRFPNCRWSTRLATPLVMLSRKSLTNNGTTKRTKQAVAGQARKVAGGAGCWMLDAGWTRAAEGARAEACPPTARRPALQREVGRRVPSFCRLSDGRLRWMFRLMSNLQDVGGRSKRRKRAPISQRRHPPSRRADSGHGPEMSAV